MPSPSERPIFHVEQWSPYEGRWTVEGIEDETAAGVANKYRVARVPRGETLVQRHIRLHEAHHALHSPPDPSDGSFLRRMVEELRVNALAHDAGVDVHLQHETCYRHWSLPIPTEAHDQLVWWLQFAATTWRHESIAAGSVGPEHEHPDISPGHRTWLRALVEAMEPRVRELAAEAGARVLASPGSLLTADNTAAWLERELREQHNSTAELPDRTSRAYCTCDHHRDGTCPHYDSARTRQRKPFYDCRREHHREDDPGCPVHHPLERSALSALFRQDQQQAQGAPSSADGGGQDAGSAGQDDGQGDGEGGGEDTGAQSGQRAGQGGRSRQPAVPAPSGASAAPQRPAQPPQEQEQPETDDGDQDAGRGEPEPGDQDEQQAGQDDAPPPAPQLGVRVLPAPTTGSASYAPNELGDVRVSVVRDGQVDGAATDAVEAEAAQRAEQMRQSPPPDAWSPSAPGEEKHAERALAKIARAREAEAARRRTPTSGGDQRVRRGETGGDHDCRVVARIGRVEVHDHLRPNVRSEVRAMPTGLRTRGTEIKSVERWWTDGAIFRKNRPGGSIAIDVSGSMSWDWDALRTAIRELPATTVAVYSQTLAKGPTGRAGAGVICMVARAGRWRDPQPIMSACRFGDYNAADLEVLTWLSRLPEPRIVLGDFEIHSGSIYERSKAARAAGQTWQQFRDDLVAQVRATMRQHRIVRCEDVATALEVVRRHGRVNGMRDVWQWNSRGLFDGKEDGNALLHLSGYFG